MLLKQMILEGVISIQSGDNHRIVEEKLKAYLAPKMREALAALKNKAVFIKI